MTFKSISGKHRLLILAACLTSVVVSCKKTELEYEKRPYNEIRSFAFIGYASDSVQAVVKSDSILIYWDSKAVKPATIRPVITISQGATISPASGAEVPFSETTVYTVTAEDGSTKKYNLKPIINVPVPSISRFNSDRYYWVGNNAITISGQYFLATGDTSDIKVHAQRLSDGFEFDMPVDRKSVTPTNLAAQFPRYSTEQDTGAHRIWLQIGNLKSDAVDTWIGQPWLNQGVRFTHEYLQEGKLVHPGDLLTINYSMEDDYNGLITRFYKGKVSGLFVQVEGGTGFNAVVTKVTDAQIEFRLPETEAAPFIGKGIEYFIASFPFKYSAQVWSTQQEYMATKSLKSVITAR